MRILVINSGSSSIKFSIVDQAAPGGTADASRLLKGELSGIGGPNARLVMRDARGDDLPLSNAGGDSGSPAAALARIVAALPPAHLSAIAAIGYRVVHPGPRLVGHQRVTDEVLRELEAAVSFAPLHDPSAIEIIREGMRRFPHLAHYACFDTEFHRTMPEEASTYPLAKEVRDRGVRRYGFHGLSCESIVRQLRATAGGVPARLVIAHLGSGCSVTAVKDGQSVDTSMGLTPTGGVVMGTRPGDLDPGLVLYLLRLHEQQDSDPVRAVEAMLNHQAGMVALSDLPNDMQALRAAAESGHAAAKLAAKVFTRSITKAIGGYCWLLGGLDAIVFAGGLGEHDAATRAESLIGLESLGVCVDEEANRADREGLRVISASHTQVAVFIVPSDEDRMIAAHVARLEA